MINIDHVCEDEDCHHIGQRTFPGCKCHKTREQMLDAEVVRLRERLAAPAQGPSTLPKGVSVSAACKAIGFCEWLSGYIGHGPAVKISSDQMDYIRSKVHPLMVDLGVVVRPPSPIPSTGLPAPAPHAEVRESDLYKLRDLIASHFACEDDCQKYPSGCGCALTAARAVQELGGK